MLSNFVDAFDKVHPDLVDLLIRLDLLPTENIGFSEANLARIIFLAIELADPDEQALLVSRIIPEEEMAAERLRGPEVQDTSHRIVLDPEERKAAFLKDPSEPKPDSNGNDCIICTESAHIQAPCRCNYCLSCYREALRMGLRSQAEFPPKCCQPFDEEAVALARYPALVHLFRQMKEEADTPIPDRVYCHDHNCAAFIPPDRRGQCLLCTCITCINCCAEAHEGQPCAEGDAEEDVWAAMDANQSVNCPECGIMVQLFEACNHMTCLCGAQFCYICGERWKLCACPQYGGFDEMVPMKDRPGVKPPQFRHRRRRVEGPTSQQVGSGQLKLPQLRPNPGEERRTPINTASNIPRVIRPLSTTQVRREESFQRRRERRGHMEVMEAAMRAVDELRENTRALRPPRARFIGGHPAALNRPEPQGHDAQLRQAMTAASRRRRGPPRHDAPRPPLRPAAMNLPLQDPELDSVRRALTFAVGYHPPQFMTEIHGPPRPPHRHHHRHHQDHHP
ncbi:e3 ubiquitin- ligase ari4 [Fusarium longipes]|uniref:E3 ubiquitin-ligase ari4 n=1 Tax=Fusarium longipes TaxID=694270 RepID=A0A395T4T7_9HYPO|nr:e3 ubiquitin- ligase ari4 [Fusarium longipes]